MIHPFHNLYDKKKLAVFEKKTCFVFFVFYTRFWIWHFWAKIWKPVMIKNKLFILVKGLEDRVTFEIKFSWLTFCLWLNGKCMWYANLGHACYVNGTDFFFNKYTSYQQCFYYTVHRLLFFGILLTITVLLCTVVCLGIRNKKHKISIFFFFLQQIRIVPYYFFISVCKYKNENKSYMANRWTLWCIHLWCKHTVTLQCYLFYLFWPRK